MDHLQFHISTDSIIDDINITIDHAPINWRKENNIIFVDVDLKDGIHKLRITDKNDNNNFKLSIESIFLNGDNLRHLLYLSYVIDRSGKRHQPATTLWESGLVWTLPFGKPLSWWVDECNRQIDANEFGTDLYKDSFIYYPEPINIRSSHSRIIQDHFLQDFRFTRLR